MIELFKGNQSYKVEEGSELYKQLREQGFLAEGEEVEQSDANEELKALKTENKKLLKEIKDLNKKIETLENAAVNTEDSKEETPKE